MSAAAWSAVAAIVSALAAGGAAIVVALIGRGVKATATQARDAAVQARDYSMPTGNGYADETRAALAEIDRAMREGFARTDAGLALLEARQVRTNATIVDHISAHARHDVERPHRHAM